MLSGLRPQLAGRVAVRLQRSVAANAESKVSELLACALELWEQGAFQRWDDGEVACTMRLFDCCDRFLRNNTYAWALVRLQYDGAQPTRLIRLGLEDPMTTPRPDIVLCIGAAEVNVEAKKLGPTSPLPRNYVTKGMMRFIDGRYASASNHFGLMIGYVLDGELASCTRAVNRVIRQTAHLGQEHQLSDGIGMGSRISRHESEHGKVQLIHHHLDLRP